MSQTIITKSYPLSTFPIQRILFLPFFSYLASSFQGFKKIYKAKKMIFPIGDDQVRGGSKPIFSYLFIGINVLVFLYEASLPMDDLNQFILSYGSIPLETMNGEDYHTLITSMFLHGSWMHLIGNMLFLYVFADNIEQIIGNMNFVIFYLVGGLAAHAGHIFFNIDSAIPTVGASGAISAVLGAYLVMFPTSKIKILVVFLFRSFKIPALLFLGFWIVQQLFSGFAAIGPETAESSGVAWWAHIGGFAFGLIAGFYYRSIQGEELERFKEGAIIGLGRKYPALKDL